MNQVETPLGNAKVAVPADEIVVATVLRAGLPMHDGILSVFDKAENAFASAYRTYEIDCYNIIRYVVQSEL